ncbi:MAG: MobA/MobL family protein [Alphaproteobacteria bacterium]|nr:MobA/MobL family protein [Alphaproteobacteria bacterium]MDY0029900.1 MobQ family relaxase [Pseudobdellovibrionaceae bacterium]
MAIYHCSLRVFSRAENHSAVAAAAYRSGQKLVDERTGTIHRYEKRLGVVNAFILMPLCAPERFQNRFALWNAAEASETRKNSRVAREVIIALPYELTTLERESLTRDMAAYLVEKYRVAVDVAIHAPVDKDGHDPRNHHAHLLFTTRELTPEGFGAKTRILDDKITGPQQIEIIREVWETLANDALSRAGHSDVNIDRRTLEAQGIERIPQIHEGKASTYDDDLHDRRHDEREEDDGTDTEDGDDGKTEGKKSGSGDAGSRSPDMSPKEDIAEKPLSEDKLETRDKSRSEFNAEIKALNEQRAEFPDKPLSNQIAEIEQEIDHLDRRVERLETLLDKTTLPQKLQKLIGNMATKAKEFLALRTEDQIKRALSESERTERHERQIARYGRTYRESIHSLIREMKDKIETLQSRETEYKKYRSFVTMIETEVMKLRASHAHTLNTPQKPDLGGLAPVIPTKTPEQVKPTAKPSEKPTGTQAKVPDEHKPSPKAERLQETFGKAQIEKQPPAQTKAEKPVQAKATPSSDTKTDPAKPVETKTTTGMQTHNSKNYKIEANAQTKQMLDKIQTELKARKAQEAAQKPEMSKATEKEAGLKGQFRKPEQPPIKQEDFIKKTKAEAQKKRQDIPPEYRAPPYTKEELNPKQKPEAKAATPPQDESVLDKFKKMWKQESAPPPPKQSNPTDTPKPRKPMSSSFNQAAKKPKDVDSSPDPEQNRDLH